MFKSVEDVCDIFCYCVCAHSTILAVAGDDFAVVASDTRLSEGFMIHSRDAPKTYRLLVTTHKSHTDIVCYF